MKNKLIITLFVFLLVLPLVSAQVNYVIQDGITREQALNALQESELEITQLENLDLGTFLIKDQLLIAKRAFIGEDPSYLATEIEQVVDPQRKAYLEDLYDIGINTLSQDVIPLNYRLVLTQTDEIKVTKQRAIELLDRIQILIETENQYHEEGVNTSSEHILILQANRSFYDERYDETEILLDQAQLELRESRTEFIKFGRALEATQGFLERYWIPLLIILVTLITFRSKIMFIYRKSVANRKIIELEGELEELNELLKQSQIDFFRTRTITKETFDIRNRKYKERLNEIKQKIPVYKAIAKGKKIKKSDKKKGILEVR